jgi:hypothetical protein
MDFSRFQLFQLELIYLIQNLVVLKRNYAVKLYTPSPTNVCIYSFGVKI